MDRRTFLSSSAAFGSSIVFAARAADSGAPPPSDAISVAVIGTGAQGQTLIEHCLAMEGVRVRALCDLWKMHNLARGSAMLSAKNIEHETYGDYREMLEREKGLQAVIVATPDSFHADQTIACMKAGLHVYCESPLSATLDGARRTVEAARETKKLLQVGFQRRSNPRYIHCAARLIGELKLLGKVTAGNAQWNRSLGPAPGWPKRFAVEESVLAANGYASMAQFRNWSWQKKFGGGPLAAFGSHQLDVFSWFLGATPKSITASGGIEHRDKKTHEWPDTVMAILEYPTAGPTVRVSCQILTNNGNLAHFEKILGDQGTLIVSEIESLTMLYREAMAPDWDRWVDMNYLIRLDKKPEETGVRSSVIESVPPSRYALPNQATDPWHRPHLQNFFDAIRGKAKLACPPEAGYSTAVTVAKINEAIETGRRIECKPEEFVA